jgi:hypothetical protein
MNGQTRFIGRPALEHFDDIVGDEMARVWKEQYKGSAPVTLKHDFFDALDKKLKEINEHNFPLAQGQEEIVSIAKRMVHQTILEVLSKK